MKTLYSRQPLNTGHALLDIPQWLKHLPVRWTAATGWTLGARKGQPHHRCNQGWELPSVHQQPQELPRKRQAGQHCSCGHPGPVNHGDRYPADHRKCEEGRGASSDPWQCKPFLCTFFTQAYGIWMIIVRLLCICQASYTQIQMCPLVEKPLNVIACIQRTCVKIMCSRKLTRCSFDAADPMGDDGPPVHLSRDDCGAFRALTSLHLLLLGIYSPAGVANRCSTTLGRKNTSYICR